MASISAVVKALGYFSLITLAYNSSLWLWIHFLRPSSLPKYLHPSKDSWALVTGASDGIGFAVARELARNGFNVFIHGRNPTKLANIAGKLTKEFPGRKIESIVADASAQTCDFTAIVSQIKSLTSNLGGNLTILVNNVGGVQTHPQFMPLDLISGEHIDQTINVNARFPTRLTAALLPLLKQNQPSLILNCGSYGGTSGIPYILTYTGTKAYVHNMTEGLRAEFVADRVGEIEALGILIGNTTSAGNRSWMVGTISSEQCARGMLAKVGCGRSLVAPHWVPWIMGNLLNVFPSGVGLLIVAGEMRKRRALELEEVEGKKGR